MKMEVLILYYNIFYHQTINRGMKLSVFFFIFNSLSLELKLNTSFFPFTLILSAQTLSVFGVGKCHLLRDDRIKPTSYKVNCIIIHPNPNYGGIAGSLPTFALHLLY